MTARSRLVKTPAKALPCLLLPALGALPSDVTVCRAGDKSGLEASLVFRADEPSARPGQVRAPAVADIYAKIRSVVDLRVEELRRTYPEELGVLEPAENQDDLGALLQKVGETVDLFFRDFPSTAAKEQVRLERLRNDGKVDEHKNVG